MKRKLLALFLVLSMCVGIFAGCSNGGSGSSSSSRYQLGSWKRSVHR